MCHFLSILESCSFLTRLNGLRLLPKPPLDLAARYLFPLSSGALSGWTSYSSAEIHQLICKHEPRSILSLLPQSHGYRYLCFPLRTHFFSDSSSLYICHLKSTASVRKAELLSQKSQIFMGWPFLRRYRIETPCEEGKIEWKFSTFWEGSLLYKMVDLSLNINHESNCFFIWKNCQLY